MKIDEFIEKHKLSCATRRKGGKPCNCGRDESARELKSLVEALAHTDPWMKKDMDMLALKMEFICRHCGAEVLDPWRYPHHPMGVHAANCVWLKAMMKVSDGIMTIVAGPDARPTPPRPDLGN